MAVVQEARNADVVAATKMNAEGQAISEQKKDKVIDIYALIDKNRIAPPPTMEPAAERKKNRKRKTKKVPAGLQEHIIKYNMIAEHSSASSGMKLGQLLLVDAEEARKQLKQFITKPVFGDARSLFEHGRGAV